MTSELLEAPGESGERVLAEHGGSVAGPEQPAGGDGEQGAKKDKPARRAGRPGLPGLGAIQGNFDRHDASVPIGAGDRDRTDDIQLGKLTFYH